MIDNIIQLLKEEDGQSMVEYGIIIALISVVAIAAIQTIGKRINNAYGTVNKTLFDYGGDNGFKESGASTAGTN